MARSLRLTKAERDWLKTSIPLLLEIKLLDKGKSAKLGASVLAKVVASEERAPGIDIGPLEDALERAARGKVIRLEGGFDRASRQAGAVKASVELMVTVGEWMARQSWLTGPMTILDVLNKWYMWLPKARATQPPPGLSPGLGSGDRDDGQSPAPAGKAPPGGRRAPGLR